MDQLVNEFLSELTKLRNKKCCGIAAGEGTGSVVSLMFGDKILRNRILKNPHLSEDVKKYDSELSLLIWCAWRLDSDSKVICSSTSPNDNNGIMVSGLKNLINREVLSVDILLPAFDLIIAFERGLFFRIFCDQTNPHDDYENYFYFSNSKAYTVGSCSSLLCGE